MERAHSSVTCCSEVKQNESGHLSAGLSSVEIMGNLSKSSHSSVVGQETWLVCLREHGGGWLVSVPVQNSSFKARTLSVFGVKK
jgi:hypothetical protein